ncbi:hypothetical protein [Nitrososphaera sp.]|uniref:hypothetical protein n=1 Tax=Nitrososphaera sp. TaxID=1971748 RepID=UPI00307EB2DF
MKKKEEKLSDLKVEILLPLYYNAANHSGNRASIEGGKYTQTYNEIIDRFGGCTIDNSPLLGGWLNPATGKEIQDENVTYWIVCKNTKSNVQFFSRLKGVLKKRFQQDEIMMYYIEIHRI